MLNFRTIWVYFMFLLIIVIANGQDPSTTMMTNLRNYYYTKCRGTAKGDPEQNFGNLDMHFSDFSKYLEYTFTLIPDRKKIFCDSETRQLEDRIVTISKDLEKCLPSGEAFLPDFIKASFKEFTHFMCHNKGENIDALFDSRGLTCLNDIQADNSGELQNCYARIFPAASSQITKKDICDNLDIMKKCFSRILDKKCYNYRRMQDLNQKFFEGISKPCSGCITSLSTLLAVFALLSYIFVQ